MLPQNSSPTLFQISDPNLFFTQERSPLFTLNLEPCPCSRAWDRAVRRGGAGSEIVVTRASL